MTTTATSNVAACDATSRGAHVGPLTIEQATSAWRALRDTLEASRATVIDLSGVTRLDTAGCRLLAAVEAIGLERQDAEHTTDEREARR